MFQSSHYDVCDNVNDSCSETMFYECVSIGFLSPSFCHFTFSLYFYFVFFYVVYAVYTVLLLLPGAQKIKKVKTKKFHMTPNGINGLERVNSKRSRVGSVYRSSSVLYIVVLFEACVYRPQNLTELCV